MIEKLNHIIPNLFNRNSANTSHYDIEPLSPMDEKYIYPLKNTGRLKHMKSAAIIFNMIRRID
jgi:hypothetical protein